MANIDGPAPNTDGPTFNMKAVKTKSVVPLTASISRSLQDEFLAKGGSITIGTTKKAHGFERLGCR